MKTFFQWINEQQKPEGSPLAGTNTKTIKTRRNRDRFSRMEAMLHELVELKHSSVERRTNAADNK
jgi:Zn-dependent M32 family carboxypeptidase